MTALGAVARLVFWRALAFLFARYELIPAPDDAPHYGAPYLDRWHFPKWIVWLHELGRAPRLRAEFLFLHHFRMSDPDRGWHNHPWEWCESRLLWGCYLQECFLPRWRERWRRKFRRGEWNYLHGQYHKITLLERPVWTLFRAGAKHGKGWGFVDEQGRFTSASGK